MRTEFLAYILETARSASISQAAERLFLRQTTLSAALRSAERELGITLFDRSYQGIRLTAQGERVLPMVEEVYNKYQALLAQAPPASSKLVRVEAMMHYRPYEHYSATLAQLVSQKLPQVNLCLLDEDEETIFSAVLQGRNTKIGITTVGECEVAVLQERATQAGLHCEPLSTAMICLFVNCKSKFAHRTTVDISELSNEHIALTRHGLKPYFSTTLHQHVPHYTQFDSSHMRFVAVAENNLITFGTEKSLRYEADEVRKQLHAIMVTGHIDEPDRHCLLYNDKKRLSPEERGLICCIRDLFQQI